MRFEPVVDYVVLVVPRDAYPDEQLLAGLTARARLLILDQYEVPPQAIVVSPIDWVITSDPDEVEGHQPAHDCASCRAGNDQARAFLAEHPDRRLALGNLHYMEVWP